MKIRIVTPEAAHADAWSQALTTAALAHHVSIDPQPLHQVNVLVNGSHPDLVISEVASATDFDALERLAQNHPELEHVLVADGLDASQLMRAMRAGVREVLTAPASAEDVTAAIQRIVRRRAPPAPAGAAAAQPARHGQVIAFLSCKGGSGATFVAANTAQMLARGGARKVALIDLNLQFGDAALFLTSQKCASDVAAVARNIHRLDRDLLASAMTEVEPGLDLLPAPEDPSQAADVAPEHVTAIIEMARAMYDLVVLDLGRTISGLSLAALDAADRIEVVMQLTLPFIRDGKRLRDVFRSLDYPASKVHWIANRQQKGGDITLDDLKRTLGIEQVGQLPNQYDQVAASVNQGVPIGKLAPKADITKALRELADRIDPPAAPAKSSGGWFSSLRR